MSVKMVRRLYKYAPFTTNLLSSLATGQLWYPKATSFNDPFDCAVIDFQRRFELGIERSNKKIIKRPQAPKTASESERQFTAILQSIHNDFLTHRSERDKLVSSMLSEFGSSLQRSLADFGILCLTEDPKNILMWSHYAANHTGVCLEFYRANGSKLKSDARPVRYVSSRYQGKGSDLVFDKFVGWQYEREWRLLEKEGNMMYRFPGPLRSIICGARMSKEHLAILRHLVESPLFNSGVRVAVKYAFMHHDKYSISIDANHVSEGDPVSS